MSRPKRRRIALTTASAIAALGVGLALAGAARGIALYAYVLALVAVAAASLSSRIGALLPTTPPFERLLPLPAVPEARVLQLENLVARLSGGNPNAFDLHHRLRPLVSEIAAARLARGYGVDLEHRPERARELVGPRTWDLIRPDRPPPLDRHERTWSAEQLDELAGELERI